MKELQSARFCGHRERKGAECVTSRLPPEPRRRSDADVEQILAPVVDQGGAMTVDAIKEPVSAQISREITPPLRRIVHTEFGSTAQDRLTPKPRRRAPATDLQSLPPHSRFDTPPPPERHRATTPPPPPQPGMMPPLMKALTQGNREEVQNVLKRDPQAAGLPFFDHSIESPLCYAVRAGCHSAIIDNLLEHEADVNMTDAHGRSPLLLLCSLVPRTNSLPSAPLWLRRANSSLADVLEVEPRAFRHEEANILKCSAQLLAAGADVCLPDNQGATAESVALASGSSRLCNLIRYYHSAQACAGLLRSAVQKQQDEAVQLGLGQLTEGPISLICAFLVPAKLMEKLYHSIHLLRRAA